MYKGLGVLKGTCSPHYNLRESDFDKTVIDANIETAYAIEDNSALEFIDGNLTKSISSGGKSYLILQNNGDIHKKIL